MNNKWFSKDTSSVIETLNVNIEEGLSNISVEKRRNTFGYNEITSQEQESIWSIYLSQYKNPLIYILLVGSIVSWATGHLVDAIAIAVIILINTGISFWQEYKAKKGMEPYKRWRPHRRKLDARGSGLIFPRASWYLAISSG